MPTVALLDPDERRALGQDLDELLFLDAARLVRAGAGAEPAAARAVRRRVAAAVALRHGPSPLLADDPDEAAAWDALDRLAAAIEEGVGAAPDRLPPPSPATVPPRSAWACAQRAVLHALARPDDPAGALAWLEASVARDPTRAWTHAALAAQAARAGRADLAAIHRAAAAALEFPAAPNP